jgi:hypothetical protein
MHFSELPLTREILGSSTKSDELARLLEQIAPNFVDWLPVEGLPFSGRLLLLEPFSEDTGFSSPRATNDLGQDLMHSIEFSEIRHHPHPACSHFLSKYRGWQIHYLWMKGRPAALALATWC